MNIVRVYSGDDGESHFQVVTPEEFAEIAKRRGTGDIQLERASFARPSRTTTPPPRRQYVVGLSGLSEFECADGTQVPDGAPATYLIAEDLTGHGHIARGLGDEPRACCWPYPWPTRSDSIV